MKFWRVIIVSWRNETKDLYKLLMLVILVKTNRAKRIIVISFMPYIIKKYLRLHDIREECHFISTVNVQIWHRSIPFIWNIIMLICYCKRSGHLVTDLFYSRLLYRYFVNNVLIWMPFFEWSSVILCYCKRSDIMARWYLQEWCSRHPNGIHVE